MRRVWSVVLLTGLAIGGLAAPARAQSMDYGALEDLFGEPVTTSVTGAPQRASEAPASMVIVTQDEIRRSGAQDIPGILRHVPGVDVLQWTNDQADVAVQGYNQAYSSSLLVLVNGRQVYTDDYGSTPWSTIPVELADIRQIEIIKGPNSALFGFNAAGGVINIVTYDPLYDQVNTASISGGTQSRVQGSAVATIPLQDWGGVRLSIGGWNGNDFSTPQVPFNYGTRRGDRRKAADLLAHVRLSSNTDVSFHISHSEAEQPEVVPTYQTFFVQYRATSIGSRLTADTGMGLISANAYMNASDARVESVTPFLSLFQSKNRVYVAQLQDILMPAPHHRIRISAEYRYNDVETTPERGAHVFYDVISGGLMWAWSIEPNLTITNAVRVDHLDLGRVGPVPAGVLLTNADWNRRALTEVSFNSGLVWQASAQDTFRVTAARGIQLPNLFDLGELQQPTPWGYAGGIPSLKPAVVMNYGVSWEHKITSWSALLRIRAFHSSTTDILSVNGGVLPLEGVRFAPANIGDSQATGAEISLNGTVDDHWRWALAYTPEVITDKMFPGFSVVNTLVDFAHTRPVHVVDARLGWSGGPWEIDGYLRYESEFQGIELVDPILTLGKLSPIPDYVAVDARIAYQVTDNLTLALSGQNLLDSPQRQTSAAAVERRVLATATIAF